MFKDLCHDIFFLFSLFHSFLYRLNRIGTIIANWVKCKGLFGLLQLIHIVWKTEFLEWQISKFEPTIFLLIYVFTPLMDSKIAFLNLSFLSFLETLYFWRSFFLFFWVAFVHVKIKSFLFTKKQLLTSRSRQKESCRV